MDVGLVERHRVNPLQGGRQQPLQSLEKLRKYKGGEHAPRNGSLALPKDVAVKPFSLKGLLNAILIILIPKLTRGLEGPLGGHADLGRSFPRLKENTLEGVLVVEVFATFLGPEIVKQETPEDVKGLAPIGEATRVVAVEVRGVIFLLENGLPKKDERPGDVEAIGHSPFVPNATESIPNLLSRGAFHEAVLGGL